MMDLDAQVAVLRDQLNALGRQVREATEAAASRTSPTSSTPWPT